MANFQGFFRLFSSFSSLQQGPQRRILFNGGGYLYKTAISTLEKIFQKSHKANHKNTKKPSLEHKSQTVTNINAINTPL